MFNPSNYINMKAFRTLITVVSLGILISYSGCSSSGGAAETTQDKQLGLLSKTWKVSTVTAPNSTDQTTSWTGFQLTISGTKSDTSTFKYSCVSRPTTVLGPWPANGKWHFGTDPTTQILRDPGVSQVPITYTLTATSLTLNFTYNGKGYQGPRVNEVAGTWIFVFN